MMMQLSDILAAVQLATAIPNAFSLERVEDKRPFQPWMLVPGAVVGLALSGLMACGSPAAQHASPDPTPTLPSVQVTADQVAQSMQDDQFFEQFGDTTLIIRGTVAAVDQQGSHTRLKLATSLPLGVVCDTSPPSPAVNVGESITVESTNPRRDASRDASSVVLNDCRLR
ncbi:MAG: hypothetical protein ACR2IK_14865 [Chloroflexota bacterium]